MFGLDLGLVANAYKGYQKGADEELARQHTAERNAMEKERWAQEKEEFALKREENARLRAERKSLAEAAKSGEVVEESDTPTEEVAPAKPRATEPESATTPLPVDAAPVSPKDKLAAPAPIASTQDATTAEPAIIQNQPAPAAPQSQPAQPAAPKASRFKVGGIYYKTREDAQAASTDAVNAATARAMRANGNIRGAMDFESSVRNAKTSDLQFKQAERKEKDDAFNRAFDDEVSKAGGDTFSAMANILTNTKMQGMDGISVEARKSPDGKTVSMVAVGPNGEKELASYPNTAAGQLAVRQRFMKADPATRTAWLEEKKKEDKELENTTWTRDMEERKLRVHQDQAAAQLANAKAQLAISGGHLKIAQQEEQRKAKAFQDEQKIPVAVKTKYAALESAAKILDTEMTRAQVNGTFDPATPAGQELVLKRAGISQQMGELLDPYVDKANDKSNVNPTKKDPLGFNGATAPAPAAPAPAAPKKATAADVRAQAAGIPR